MIELLIGLGVLGAVSFGLSRGRDRVDELDVAEERLRQRVREEYGIDPDEYDETLHGNLDDAPRAPQVVIVEMPRASTPTIETLKGNRRK